MNIVKTNVTQTIAQAREMLKDNKKVSSEFSAIISVLLTVLEVLLERRNKNSQNSSLPPSQDQNRQKKSRSGAPKRKAGGQPGRTGTTLKPIKTPDM